MELVTEPDIDLPRDAKNFAQELQLILRYLDVSEANMEKGQMRCEVNISLTKEKDAKIKNKLGTKVEIKNLNSFRVVEEAIKYEIKRQTEVLEKGEKVIQETRGWDDNKKLTISQRKKEEAHDYRYFPEPDLPPLETSDFKNQALKEIPELPSQRRKRLKEEYNLSDKDIELFVVYKNLGEYFEKVMSEFRNWVKEDDCKEKVDKKEFLELVKLCSNYITTDLQGLLKGASVCDKSFLITPENFAELITLIYKKKISSKLAKIILGEMFKAGADPSHIIKENGLSQMTDQKELNKIIEKVISVNEKAFSDFKGGKANAMQFLIGQVMALTKGKAAPDLISKILKQILEN